jgi:hypothetical protein
VRASHLPGARVTENIAGCLWTALARDALLAAAEDLIAITMKPT